MDAAPANEQHLVSIPAWLQMPTLIDWAPPVPPQIIDIAAVMKAEQERISNFQNMVNAQLHAGDTRQALAEIRGAVEYPTTNNAANIHDASQDAESDDEKNDCCPPAVGLDDGPPLGIASIVTIMTAAADRDAPRQALHAAPPRGGATRRDAPRRRFAPRPPPRARAPTRRRARARWLCVALPAPSQTYTHTDTPNLGGGLAPARLLKSYCTGSTRLLLPSVHCPLYR